MIPKWEREEIITPREGKIIGMRYGIEDGKQYTYKEVGREFGITRERVRQIEDKALEKIRSKDFPKKTGEQL